MPWPLKGQARPMEAKKRWEKGFMGSFIFHALIFIMLAFITAAGASNSTLKNDGYVEVDYFSGTGGGGGGGGGGEKPITHSILEDRPTGSGGDDAQEADPSAKVQNHDTEQIVDKTQQNTDEQKNTRAPSNDSQAIYPGADQLPNTGTGGGYGTGTGTGIGSGTGSGSGSGSGGGHGSGTGTGIGSGSGAGTGGNVSQIVSVPPRLLSTDRLRYPESARRANVEGTARVRIYLNDKGKIDGVEIISSTGNEALDEEALRYARTHSFQPARNAQGVAIKVTTVKAVTFKLTD